MEPWQVDAENGSGQMMPKGLGTWEVPTSFPLGLCGDPYPTNKQTNKQTWAFLFGICQPYGVDYSPGHYKCWGSIVSSCRVHLALENDGLRKDDTQYIFLGNNILFSRKGCGIVSPTAVALTS